MLTMFFLKWWYLTLMMERKDSICDFSYTIDVIEEMTIWVMRAISRGVKIC